MTRFATTIGLLCGALCLSVSGCAGAPTRIHTLDAVPGRDGPSGAGPAALFRVDAVHVPAAYDRPELVRRSEPYTLTLSDNDRWAAPLGELVRRTLTQDLTSRLPAGSVVFPDAPKPDGASGLVIDILAISPTPRGIEMDASWSWIAPRTPLQAGSRPPAALIGAPRAVHLVAPSAGLGTAAVAPQLSALVALLADAISADAGKG